MTPSYDFRCPNCSTSIEVKRSLDESTVAPTCGDCLVAMEKVFHATPAIFKGTGWGARP